VEGAGATPAARSCAAAATEALATTRMVGSPSPQALAATSVSARAYPGACGEPAATRSVRSAVGAARHRRALLAASKKPGTVEDSSAAQA